MSRCLISFGANLGQATETILQAAEQLKMLLGKDLHDFQLSRLFRTPAVGGPTGQPPFINAVAALYVEKRTAWDVWQIIGQIEQALGRVRIERWEARRIDLDVLLFEDQRIWTQHFKLPHPRMVMRRFILEPALDVAADWIDPVSGWSISQLTHSLRHGPASIVLVSNNLAQAQRLLERSAAQSRSMWLEPHCITHSVTHRVTHSVTDKSCPTDHMSKAVLPSARWLGVLPDAFSLDRPTHIEPAPKLVCLLVNPMPDGDCAWEDYHRPQAIRLGMALGSKEELHRWPLEGPRYLMASDDLAWAEHEIVAAMEAMDCPIEAL